MPEPKTPPPTPNPAPCDTLITSFKPNGPTYSVSNVHGVDNRISTEDRKHVKPNPSYTWCTIFTVLIFSAWYNFDVDSTRFTGGVFQGPFSIWITLLLSILWEITTFVQYIHLRRLTTQRQDRWVLLAHISLYKLRVILAIFLNLGWINLSILLSLTILSALQILLRYIYSLRAQSPMQDCCASNHKDQDLEENRLGCQCSMRDLLDGSRRDLNETSRPLYFCTANRSCGESFTSSKDWRRHDSTQHYYHECWLCTEQLPKSSSTPCMQVFYNRPNYKSHLEKDHKLVGVSNQIIEAHHLGPNASRRFWCGSCNRIIELTDPEDDPEDGLWGKRWTHLEHAHCKATYLHYIKPGIGVA